jgi:hypothetical protein
VFFVVARDERGATSARDARGERVRVRSNVRDRARVARNNLRAPRIVNLFFRALTLGFVLEVHTSYSRKRMRRGPGVRTATGVARRAE